MNIFLASCILLFIFLLDYLYFYVSFFFLFHLFLNFIHLIFFNAVFVTFVIALVSKLLWIMSVCFFLISPRLKPLLFLFRFPSHCFWYISLSFSNVVLFRFIAPYLLLVTVLLCTFFDVFAYHLHAY